MIRSQSLLLRTQSLSMIIAVTMRIQSLRMIITGNEAFSISTHDYNSITDVNKNLMNDGKSKVDQIIRKKKSFGLRDLF